MPHRDLPLLSLSTRLAFESALGWRRYGVTQPLTHHTQIRCAPASRPTARLKDPRPDLIPRRSPHPHRVPPPHQTRLPRRVVRPPLGRRRHLLPHAGRNRRPPPHKTSPPPRRPPHRPSACALTRHIRRPFGRCGPMGQQRRRGKKIPPPPHLPFRPKQTNKQTHSSFFSLRMCL